jgi:hypothetical protein
MHTHCSTSSAHKKMSERKWTIGQYSSSSSPTVTVLSVPCYSTNLSCHATPLKSTAAFVCLLLCISSAQTFPASLKTQGFTLHSTVLLTEVLPSPPPSPLPPYGDSVGVDTEGGRLCWSLCWCLLLYVFALQTAFTFDGTDDARRLSVYYRAA